MSTAGRVWAAIGALLLIGVWLNSEKEDQSFSRSPAPIVNSGNTVVYSVTGTAVRVSVTQENDTGGTDQGVKRVPYRVTFDDFDDGDFVYISAQNDGETGTLKCEIIVNGRTVYEANASGAYAICTASGRVP